MLSQINEQSLSKFMRIIGIYDVTSVQQKIEIKGS
jgi:hypothetical protein